MAVIYFVKDGHRPQSSGHGYVIKISDMVNNVANMKPVYLGMEPPEFRVDSPSEYPTVVVLKIAKGECVKGLFENTGFYELRGVSTDNRSLKKIPMTLDIDGE